MHPKPLTDLTSKRFADRIVCSKEAREALYVLKDLLCRATNDPLFIIDTSKPFLFYVDSCDYAVGAVLTQSRGSDTGSGYRIIPWRSPVQS